VERDVSLLLDLPACVTDAAPYSLPWPALLLAYCLEEPLMGSTFGPSLDIRSLLNSCLATSLSGRKEAELVRALARDTVFLL